MTFSIVARCPRTGQFGVGAVTGMVGVGKLASHARSLTGAVATQAFTNPYYGIDGLRLLADGLSAPEALEHMLACDPRREKRQVGIVDSHGRVAAFTGSLCAEWAGHRMGIGYTTQGNRLVGPATLDVTAQAFEDNADKDLAMRILIALEAGQATGADRQGAESGSIYVVDQEEYPLWDMRVDNSRRPIDEMRELYRVFAEELIPQMEKLPTRDDPEGQLYHGQGQRMAG
ncbi:MAG: DUF1028 domain-containing protein [Phycisphaeraceae bacterium]